MTPAINILKKSNIHFTIHEYRHDRDSKAYGKEAAQSLGVNEDQMFKTILVVLYGNKKYPAVGMVPVSRQLNLKSFAQATGSKKAELAEPGIAERTTGYLVGGISPFGQKKHLQTIIDRSALQFKTIFVSGGKRGLQIELAPTDLIQLCDAEIADIRR